MLEIHVFDKIETADSVQEALKIILESFRKWYVTDDDVPFTLTVKKIKNKAPPSLNIHIGDTIKSTSAFG